jgi:phage terminase small subunit
MPVLDNPRHERFAQALAEGKTADEAYADAGYEANRGNAARLKANESISARVTELLGNAAERAECTVATILTELEEARQLALETKQPAPAVSASMGKAKVAGLLIDKAELTGKDGGPIETADLTDADVARRVGFILNKGVLAQKPTEH